jgi:hypothetical protein
VPHPERSEGWGFQFAPTPTIIMSAVLAPRICPILAAEKVFKLKKKEGGQGGTS